MEKIFNDQKKLIKEYAKNANKIMMRMQVLRAASALSQISTKPPERCHELSKNRKGEFSVDLIHPFRLIFKPNHDPVPTKEDSGIDLTKVTAIKIIEVVDYH